MKAHARLKQKEVSATKATSTKVVASSLGLANDFKDALASPAIAMLPACIRKKGEKAEVELLAVQQKAQEKLCSSDPEPWDESFVREWPSKLSTWKSICELLSKQCELVSSHA